MKQDQRQQWHPSRDRRKPRMNLQGHRREQRALKKNRVTSMEILLKERTHWGNRRHQNRDHGRQWCQQRMEQSHGRGQQYHQRQGSSCKHQSNRWIDENLHPWRFWHRWQDEYERNPRSKRRVKKRHQLHHQKQHCQRTTSSNLHSS